MDSQNFNNSFPPAPSPHKSWFSIHHVLAYLIVAALFIAAVAWVYVMQKADNVDTSTPVHQVKNDITTDWKTYSNAQAGYEFKYPADWTLKNGSELGISSEYNYVAIQKDLSDNDFEKISFSSSQKDLAVGTSYDKTGSDITLASASWKTGQYNDGVPGQGALHNTLSLNTKNQNIFYQINLYPNDSLTVNPDLGQILSTFKFTVSNDVSEWKTYTNNEYGFEFKYPANLNVFDASTTAADAFEVSDRKENNYCTEFCSGMWFNIESNTQKLTLNEWWNERGFTEGDQISSVKINNIDALKVVLDPNGLGETHYLIKKDLNMFDIVNNQEEGDQILSTFKFTK